MAQLVADTYFNVNERELTEILTTLVKMGHLKQMVEGGVLYVEAT